MIEIGPTNSRSSARYGNVVTQLKPVVAHLDHAESLHAVEKVGDSAFHAIRVVRDAAFCPRSR
jgi:hypothetical protein